MAARTDFIRLDAEHAARVEISKVLEKYKRRIYEDAKAHISEKLTSSDPGVLLDGTSIGEEAVERAITGYLGSADAQPAIEVGATPEPE